MNHKEEPKTIKKHGERYREDPIIYALRQVEGGRKITEVCREIRA